MANILDLPPEVRAVIFEYCLAVGKIFPLLKRSVYKDQNLVHEAFKYDGPDVALMSVCRRFNREATPILYQQNTLALGSALRSWIFFGKLVEPTSRLSVSRLSWLKLIEIHVSSIEMSFSDRLAICSEETAKTTADPGKPPGAHYAINSSTEHMCHGYKIHQAEIFWLLKQSCIFAYASLDKLDIRLRNTPCRAPCCHPQTRPHGSFSANYHPSVPNIIHLHSPTPIAATATTSAPHVPDPTGAWRRSSASQLLDTTSLRRRLVEFWIAEEKAGRVTGGGATGKGAAGRGEGSEAREHALAVAKRTQNGMNGRWRNLG